ncbi:cytochrome c isoform 2 [Starmerella bacillaris]|uniref:Cytochrome c isoform 2 n=1 Tax=Starmerella bacillaris TaxID=1247836 RepID=A0AAV5RJZ5_STABA|nr:cytochrome c isoform 2 [Starmerella bacillaris]
MAGNSKKGAKLFKTRCAQCHVVDDTNKVGPGLKGVLGRQCGTKDGFSFSDAMKDKGISWDESTFHEYISNPKKYIPGNKMAFAGLKKKADIDDLYAYISSATK